MEDAGAGAGAGAGAELDAGTSGAELKAPPNAAHSSGAAGAPAGVIEAVSGTCLPDAPLVGCASYTEGWLFRLGGGTTVRLESGRVLGSDTCKLGAVKTSAALETSLRN